VDFSAASAVVLRKLRDFRFCNHLHHESLGHTKTRSAEIAVNNPEYADDSVAVRAFVLVDFGIWLCENPRQQGVV